MSNLLGVIRAVIGQVYVVEADGSQRLLKEGDRIYSGEEIVTGDSGAVSVSLPDGKTLDLGRNSHWTEHGLNAVSSAEHDSQDVASLQKAIADGADPTQALEATAAGNEPPVQIEGGGGGHTLVQLELTGEVVDPTAGFNTQGIGAPTWTHNLPEGAEAADSPPVLPPLVQIDNFAGNDGFINKNEINHANINGTSNQSHITLLFTDSQKNTLTIDVDVIEGHWTTLPDLSGLAEGEISVIATATDVSGRSAHSTADAIKDVTDLHDAITIDNVTADNVINIAESHNAQTSVHGTVSGDAKVGDKITLTVNGHEYTDVVIDLGNGALGYRIDVSTQGLLADPNIHATVTSTDEAGNTTQASSDHHVDIDLDIHNTISIETVAGDDIVNAAESRMPTMVTGVAGGDAQAGDAVTVTLGGRDFHGVVVNVNGQLSYEVPVPTNLLNEGANDVKVQIVSHDAAGNEAIAIEHKNVVLDTQAHNALNIDTVATDNVVNANESRMPTFISGVVSGDAQAGDHVVVSDNGKQFYGEVVTDENGHLRYEIPVPTNALNEGRNDVQVMVAGVDASGNTAIAVEHKTVVLDTHADANITINDVTKDNVLNHAELADAKQTITGTVDGDAKVGDDVTLDINGHKFTGQVGDLGNGKLGYHIDVDPSAFSNNQGEIDTDVNFQATVTSFDSAGNEVIAITDHTVHIDNHANNALTISTVSKDGVVNNTESQGPTFINGQVSGPDAKAGDPVLVTVNGKVFTGEVVADAKGHLHYHVALASGALNEGDNDVEVAIASKDAAGNDAVAVEHRNVVLDTHADATISINDVTPDNTLNHSELDGTSQTITGSVKGDARVGDKVTLDIHGHKYTGQVVDLGNGKLGYSIDVDPRAFSNNKGEIDTHVNFTASVTSHDTAGNETTATNDHTVRIDNHANNGVTIGDVAGENTVNAIESRMPTFISGDVTGPDAKAGDDVAVSVNGHVVHGKVVAGTDGKLHYEVPVPTGYLSEGNNDVAVTVISHDDVGNIATAIEHHNVTLDTQANATIAIDKLTDDNVLNRDELRNPEQTITGTVGGDAKVGDEVTLDFNGHKYGGQVVELGGGHLGYHIGVDTSEFGNGRDEREIDKDVHFTAAVKAHDAAGNEVIQITNGSVHIDNHANDIVNIGDVAGENTVNAIENRMPTFISGDVGGDAKAGDDVVVLLHGQRFEGKVVMWQDGKLHYEVQLPTGALQEGPNDVQVLVTSHDAAGNGVTSVEHKNVVLDTHANTSVTINDATSDNILNHSELGQDNRTISGIVGGDAQIGDEVTIEINGNQYVGHVIDMGDGKGTLGYKIPVLSSEFGDNNTILNKDVSVTVTLISHDAAGNEAIATNQHTIHVDNHAYNGVNINTVAADNVVNFGESHHETLVTGNVFGKDAKAGDKVVLRVQNHDYNGFVVADVQGHLHYEVPIPTGILHEGNNDVTVKVTSHDAAGNTAVATEQTHVMLDTQAKASITIDELTAGPVLNHDELDTPKQLITGTVGDDARVGDKVSIEINGHYYGGTVIVLGNGHLGYQIPVDSAAFGDNQKTLNGNNVKITAAVTSHDAAGNETTATSEHTVHVDNHANAGITIAPVTGDGIINGVESTQGLTKVSGTVSGDVHKGDEVLVMVNGHPYEATVHELPHQNGALGYSVDVSTSDLLADPNPTAYIVGYDAAGNIQLAHATENVGIDLQADATITIDPVTGDNMINAAESRNEFTTVTGTVGEDVKVGDLVHLNVNGIDMTTPVFRDPVTGTLGYSIQVSTYDLMADPHITATVTTTDNANNVVTVHADQTIVIDTRVDAVITVDSVTPDNTLNGDELKHGYTLVSGSVKGEMNPGDPLTLTINHVVYNGFVEDLGNGKMGYHIPVSTADLKADPHIHASISVTDTAQNSAVATANHTVNIDDHATASVTINIVSGDDILNANDQLPDTTIINGKVSGDVKAGDIVHVIVHGVDYPATVGDQGHGLGLGYSIAVSTAGLLADPHIVATVDAKDGAGNTITAGTTHDISRDDGAQATITVNPVTDDNVINNAEAHKPHTTITGNVTDDVHPGDVVDLDINGQHYYGTVDKNLGYSIDVSTDDLLSTKNPVIHASVTGYDAAGNTVLATTDHPVGVDTRADASIDVHDLQINGSSDFWIIQGYVGGDAKEGDPIKIHLGNVTYDTSVIRLPDGHLGYNGDNLIDPTTGKHVYLSPDQVNSHPDITVEVTSTDQYGNTETATAHVHANVPVLPPDGSHNGGTTTPPPHTPPDVDITISPIAGNNVINQQESQSGQTTIRGTVSGDVHVGDDVIIYLGTRPYHGQVFELPNLPGEHGYKIDVDTDELKAHPGFSVTMFGGTSHAEGMVTFDTDVHATISLDDIAGDNVINIVESQSGTTTLTGKVSGDGVHEGSNVTITLNNHQITTQVTKDAHGDLIFTKEVSTDDLRQDPHITVSVTGHDDQGNEVTVFADKTITVDTYVAATVSIDNVTHDNILNLAESQQDKTAITGHVTGDVKAGEHVTLHVNGVEYKDVEIDGNLNYKVDVLTCDLNKGNVITAEVTGHDDAGNTITGTATHHYSLDTSAAATITMHTVSGDNILSANDLNASETQISGIVEGDAAIGDDVTITLNGVPKTVQVIELPNMNGQLGYTMKVDTVNLKAELEAELKNHPNDKPTITVTISGTDSAGNAFDASATREVTIDDHANVELHVNKVSGDDTLNKAESGESKTEISGTVSGDVNVGDNVIVHVNGNDLTAKIVQDPVTHELTFKLDVPTADLLQDQTITYKVTGVDEVGNSKTISETKTLIIDQVAENHIHIDTISGDDRINIDEHQLHTTNVTGVVTGDAHDGDTVTIKVNGHNIPDVHLSEHNGQLTYEIPVDNSLLNEGDNNIEVTVSGHDEAGNPATSTDTRHFTLDTKIDATISIDPVASDNFINAKESQQLIHVTGVVDGDAHDGDIVTLDVNGHSIQTTVVPIGDHLGYDAPMKTEWLHEGDNNVTVNVQVTDDAGNRLIPAYNQVVNLDTHADATLTVNKVAGDNHINSREAHHELTHITGEVEGDVHKGDHITATIGDKHFDAILHETDGHLTYDIPVNTAALHAGDNKVTVSIDAHDEHGNSNTYSQDVNVTVDAAHHHAATHNHGLSSLFDDSHDSLTFNLDHHGKDHQGHDDHKVFTGKASDDHGKVDLSDLAHELHEGSDITQLIKGGDAHGGKGDAVHPVHSGGEPAHIMDHDSHGSSSYSLDSLIAKPEHYSH